MQVTNDLPNEVVRVQDPKLSHPRTVNTKRHPCAHCRKRTPTKQCSRCKVSRYCSRDCQKADWRNHKRICKLLEMKRPGLEKIKSDLEKKLPNQEVKQTSIIDCSLCKKPAHRFDFYFLTRPCTLVICSTCCTGIEGPSVICPRCKKANHRLVRCQFMNI